jgi:hypothetical protein
MDVHQEKAGTESIPGIAKKFGSIFVVLENEFSSFLLEFLLLLSLSSNSPLLLTLKLVVQ